MIAYSLGSGKRRTRGEGGWGVGGERNTCLLQLGVRSEAGPEVRSLGRRLEQSYQSILLRILQTPSTHAHTHNIKYEEEAASEDAPLSKTKRGARSTMAVLLLT